jgi:hypothetical protein
MILGRIILILGAFNTIIIESLSGRMRDSSDQIIEILQNLAIKVLNLNNWLCVEGDFSFLKVAYLNRYLNIEDNENFGKADFLYLRGNLGRSFK